MADERGLELVIKANVENATAGFNEVQAGLAKTATAALKTDSALDRTVKSTNEATFALTNLGRVVQDAPYGFIGIANNLNPLLESFQRLKASTGTTGGALKELGKSFIGAGGLGFAISIVSTALVLFGDKLFNTTKQADKAKEAFDGLLDSAAKEALKLKESFAAVTDANIPLANRKKIIDDLRSSYGVYLKNISDEALLTGQAAAAYDLINNAILKKLQLQALEDKILPLIKEQVNLQYELNKAEQDGLNIRKVIEGTSGSNISKLQKDNAVAIAQSNENLGKQYSLQRQIARVGQEINNIFRSITPLLQFDDVAIRGTNEKKIKESIIRQVFPEGQLTDVFPVKIPLTIDTVLDKNASLSIKDSITEAMRRAMEELESIGFKFPDNFFRMQSKDRKKLIENFKSIGGIVSETVGDVFNKIAENLGNFTNPFSGIFEIIGAGLQKLGTFVIAGAELISKIKTALNAALTPLGSAAGIAIGVGLLALGTVMKNIPRLAEGGIIPPGYPNDSFPAMLQSGEAVIPLDKLRNFIPNAGNGIRVEIIGALRGQTINLQQRRQTLSNRRNL